MKNKLIVGRMNSGKTVNNLFKCVDEAIKNDESMFILDSKYEYISAFYDTLIKNNYNVKIIDLRNLDNSETYNPLTLPYKLYKENKKDYCLELLDKLINYIVKTDVKESIDPFWDNSAADLIVGTILTLFANGKEEEINLCSVANIIRDDKRNNYYEKYKDTEAYKYVDSIISSPKETLGGIISVALQKLRVYITRENLSKWMSKSSFSFAELINQKSVVFFVNYASTNMYNSLVNTFIAELYMYLENNKANNQFNFILDNFDSLGYIYDFYNILSIANAYKINFIIGTRDLELFKEKYGNIENVADVIKATEEVEATLGEKITYKNNLPDKIFAIELDK